MKEGRKSGGFDAIAFIINNYDYFMEHGMEGNFPFFNVEKYKAANPDLQTAFGENMLAYLNHYLTFGIYESRDSHGEIDIVYMAKLNPNMDLSIDTDLSKAPEIVSTFVEQVKVTEAERVAEVKAAQKEATSQDVFLGGTIVKDNENKIFYNYDAYNCALQAWLSSEPILDAYLAETDYAEHYWAWESQKPDISNYLTEAGLELYYTWLDAQPDYWEYLMQTGFKDVWEAWDNEAPQREDFKVGYVDEDAAQEAFDADHAEWEANAPQIEEFADMDAYEEAMAEYTSTNPEPEPEDYPYFEDGFDDADAAQLAYEAAQRQWEADKEEAANSLWQDMMDEWLEENPAPDAEQYKYVENTFASADEAADALQEAQDAYDAAQLVTEPDPDDYKYCTWTDQDEATTKYGEDQAAWEEAKATALEGLEMGTTEYNDAFNAFVEEYPEPDPEEYIYFVNTYGSVEEAAEALEDAQQAYEEAQLVEEPDPEKYTYFENTYGSAEEAAEALENANNAWEATKPVKENNEDLQTKVDEWVTENEAPVESTFTDKINEFESQDEATAKFEEDHAAWEAGAPKVEDYADTDAYNEAMDEYVAENPEPTIDDGNYELGYATEEDAQQAFEDAMEEHDNEMPYDEDRSYIEQTTYDEDHKAWEENQPDYTGEFVTDGEGNSYEDVMTEWESEVPVVDDYIADTTYEEDHNAWVEAEPKLEDFVIGGSTPSTPVEPS